KSPLKFERDSIALSFAGTPGRESPRSTRTNFPIDNSPFIRKQFAYGYHQAAAPSLRLHLRIRAGERLFALFRRNLSRHGAEFSGDGAQTHFQLGEKRPAQARLQPQPLY